jgi:hypothetical protein
MRSEDCNPRGFAVAVTPRDKERAEKNYQDDMDESTKAHLVALILAGHGCQDCYFTGPCLQFVVARSSPVVAPLCVNWAGIPDGFDPLDPT